ncbi:hypothetical protein [Fervidobacterium sp.]
MTEAAYFLSKEAEGLLAPYVQILVGAKDPPKISSPFSATPWDYDFKDLFIDLKLAPEAPKYGRVADQTLGDIRFSLQKGISVALFVPYRLYLLQPWDITWDGSLESLRNRPSVLLPKEVVECVRRIYQKMLNS